MVTESNILYSRNWEEHVPLSGYLNQSRSYDLSSSVGSHHVLPSELHSKMMGRSHGALWTSFKLENFLMIKEAATNSEPIVYSSVNLLTRGRKDALMYVFFHIAINSCFICF